jgi:hypothetical protein
MVQRKKLYSAYKMINRKNERVKRVSPTDNEVCHLHPYMAELMPGRKKEKEET